MMRKDVTKVKQTNGIRLKKKIVKNGIGFTLEPSLLSSDSVFIFGFMKSKGN